jgi:hypothetical protein
MLVLELTKDCTKDKAPSILPPLTCNKDLAFSESDPHIYVMACYAY